MGIMVQTEFRGSISTHLKMGIFSLIKNGDKVKEQVVDTGFSNILIASARNPETGKIIKCKWGRGTPCVLVGPLTSTDKIVKLRVEGL